MDISVCRDQWYSRRLPSGDASGANRGINMSIKGVLEMSKTCRKFFKKRHHAALSSLTATIIIIAAVAGLLMFGGFGAKEAFASSQSTAPAVPQTSSVPPITILNNGGAFVQYGDAVYYYEYNFNSHVDRFYKENGDYLITPPDVSSIPASELIKNVKRITQNGDTETVFNDSGSGGIFICNDRFFFNGYSKGEEGPIYSVNLHGEDRREHGDGKIYGYDEKTGMIIVVSSQEAIYSLNPVTGKRTKLADTGEIKPVIALKAGVVYYYESTGDMMAGTPPTISVKSVKTDGSGKKELFSSKKASKKAFEGSDFLECTACEVIGDSLYVVIGSFSGHDYYFDGGSLLRIKTDGSGATFLAGSAKKPTGKNIYLMRDGGKEYICYGFFTGDDSKEITVRRSLQAGGAGKEEPWGKPVHKARKPFFIDGELCMYTDNSGVVRKLISKELFKNLGVKEKLPVFNEQRYIAVEEAELVGDWLYFTIDRFKAIGESNYTHVKSNTYRYSLTGKRAELLYSR